LSSDFEVIHAALPIRLWSDFQRLMVELVRSGYAPEELAREFEPTAKSISAWVKQGECEIVRNLRRAASTISGELRRNGLLPVSWRPI